MNLFASAIPTFEKLGKETKDLFEDHFSEYSIVLMASN